MATVQQLTEDLGAAAAEIAQLDLKVLLLDKALKMRYGPNFDKHPAHEQMRQMRATIWTQRCQAAAVSSNASSGLTTHYMENPADFNTLFGLQVEAASP